MTTGSKFGASKLLNATHATLLGQERVNAEMFTAMEILGRKLERAESERDRLTRRLALIESSATLDEKTGKLYLPAVIDPALLSRQTTGSGASRWMVASSLASSAIALFALGLVVLHEPPSVLTQEQIAALESLKPAQFALVRPENKGWQHLGGAGEEVNPVIAAAPLQPVVPALPNMTELAKEEQAAEAPQVVVVRAIPPPPVNVGDVANVRADDVLIPGEDKVPQKAKVKVAVVPSVEKKVLAPVAAETSDTTAPDPALPEKLAQLEKRAYEGIPEAQHDMATLYASGKLVAQNYKRAIGWFTKSADGGVANAHYNLGVIYQQGLGVKPDMTKALGYYEKAAELGHPEAMYNLGIAYIEGIGTKTNIEKGISYFKRAANAGVSQAAFNLGVLYESNFVGTIDTDKAVEWYQVAADAGHAEARGAVGRLTGVASDQALTLADTVEPASGEEFGEGDSSPVEEGGRALQFKGDLLSKIQHELIRLGMLSGTADGVMTPQTEDAIRVYQQTLGVPQDGEASAALLDTMRPPPLNQ